MIGKSILDRGYAFRSFAELDAAGYSIEMILDYFIQSTQGREARVLRWLGSRVKRGAFLSEAMAESGEFPFFEVAMIRAGERNGQLSTMARLIFDQYRLRGSAWNSIRSHLWQPILMLIAAIASGPALVWMLGRISFWELLWRVAWPLGSLAIGFRLLILLHQETFRRPRLAYLRDRLARRVPWAGKKLRLMGREQFFRNWAIFLRAGYSLPESIQMAADLVSDEFIQNEARRLQSRVAAGDQIWQALQKSSYFLPSEVDSIRVGAEAGKLPAILDDLAIRYGLEITEFYSTLSKWVPRAIYILIAISLVASVLQFWKARLV